MSLRKWVTDMTSRWSRPVSYNQRSHWSCATLWNTADTLAWEWWDMHLHQGRRPIDSGLYFFMRGLLTAGISLDYFISIRAIDKCEGERKRERMSGLGGVWDRGGFFLFSVLFTPQHGVGSKGTLHGVYKVLASSISQKRMEVGSAYLMGLTDFFKIPPPLLRILSSCFNAVEIEDEQWLLLLDLVSIRHG